MQAVVIWIVRKGMKFDYSGVDFSIESSGLSTVKK